MSTTDPSSPEFTTIHDLSHDPELATALGNMVIVWAYAETILLTIFAKVANITINMAAVGYYRIPTFEARVKFLVALITEWKTDKDKEALTKAIEKLAKLAKTRNGWIHAQWVRPQAGSAGTFTVDFRAPLGERVKPVKATDILFHNQRVVGRVSDLIQLSGFEPPAI